ncbi:response regulator [Paenibacillus koleovorans]|uniref:response regulator n=1 Tax=Paenibacillus koleovorans TaxID=121608 RepID=UPI0013E3BD9C|nr:response regulator [Paenibacillus koleovorans]
MIRDLFVNIALLALFIFFTGQWFMKAYSESQLRWAYRLKVGLVMGGVGVVLLFAGVRIDENNLLDLRHQAVYAAAYFGGLPASLIAAVVIIVVRIAFDFSSSLPAIATGLLIALISGLVIRYVRSDLIRFLLFYTSFGIIFTIDLVWIFNFSFSRVALPYVLMNIVCGAFISAFLLHMKRSNGLMEQVRTVQQELLDILHLQPGYTIKYRKEKGRYVYTMAEGQLLYQVGFDPKELIGTSVMDSGRLPKELAEYMYEQFDKAWQGERVTFEISYKGYTALATLEPIVGRDGEMEEVICSAVNITDRKQAEKTLVENELKYRTLVDSSEDLIFGFDETGIVTSANQKIVDVLEVPFRQLIGRSFSELLPGRHEEEWWDYFRLALAERRRLRFELAMALPGLGDRTFSVTLSPVYGQDGAFRSMTGTIHDLTDIIKKKQADEANQAKTQFLARMSHEIRTPLSGIIGIAELMAKTELTGSQIDYVSKIQSSSQALLRIINEILDFSKVEAGKLGLVEDRFHFMTVIKKLSGTIHIFMGKQQIEFILDTPDSLPDVLIGDAQRLEQVLLNLCGNAIKFTERGHVALRIRTVDDRSSFPLGIRKLRLRFDVTDSGIGIAADHLRSLFEPFSQADGSTSRKYGGTGLGLVISKSLIELMGGELSVQSGLGEGSHFSFELSFPVPEDAKTEAYRLSERNKGQRVLVLEDSVLVYEQLGSMLASMELTPVKAATWKEAIGLLEWSATVEESERIQLVLADMEMDDMYGIDTWMNLLEAARRAGAHTMAMTSVYGRDELLGLSEQHRPDATLVKPISRPGLHEQLAVVLERGGRRRSKGVPHPVAEPEQAAGAPAGRILLAEDNEINELVATELLKDWGYQVEVAHNGLEVLEMIDRGKWDLILMDIHMPEMDGYEATRRIREMKRYDRLPIVALTANVIRSDRDSYYRIGMNDIVTKPIDVEAMRITVRKWVTSGVAGGIVAGAVAGAGAGGGEPLGDRRNETDKSEEERAYADSLSKLDGIELNQVLHRLDGKVPLLLHLLRRFRQEYEPFVEQLQDELDRGEWDSAKRMLHTFRGAAGNMSASELLAAATELEHALAEPAAVLEQAQEQEKLRSLLTSLEDEHRRVMVSIGGVV